MPHEKLNDVFLTLQDFFLEVIKTFGGNKYKIPHMAKDKLRREGNLPENMTCPFSDYQDGSIHLGESTE
jgi:hypothetical protein